MNGMSVLKQVVEGTTRIHCSFVLKRYASGSQQVLKYSKGDIPKSLLLKQEHRLNKSSNKPLDDHNPMGSAISDVFSLFKPDAMTKEDEQMAQQEYKQKINDYIKGDKFKILLENKLQLNQQSQSLRKDSLVDGIKSLLPFEYDVIHEFVVDSDLCSKDWKNLPIYAKQLQYYMSYGPLGPRSSGSLDLSPFVTSQPNNDLLSRVIISAFLLISSLGFIKYKFIQKDEAK
ncbi:genetic interactor of prohibitin 7, mitochondrial [Monosporozyma servazzii]